MEGSYRNGQGKAASPGRLLGHLLLGGLCLALLCLPRLRAEAEADRLEEEIRRALSAAYAASGAYPQSLEGLEGWGPAADGGRYRIRFVPLGDNQMPDVEVFLRGQRP